MNFSDAIQCPQGFQTGESEIPLHSLVGKRNYCRCGHRADKYPFKNKEFHMWDDMANSSKVQAEQQQVIWEEGRCERKIVMMNAVTIVEGGTMMDGNAQPSSLRLSDFVTVARTADCGPTGNGTTKLDKTK